MIDDQFAVTGPTSCEALRLKSARSSWQEEGSGSPNGRFLSKEWDETEPGTVAVYWPGLLHSVGWVVIGQLYRLSVWESPTSHWRYVICDSVLHFAWPSTYASLMPSLGQSVRSVPQLVHPFPPAPYRTQKVPWPMRQCR